MIIKLYDFNLVFQTSTKSDLKPMVWSMHEATDEVTCTAVFCPPVWVSWTVSLNQGRGR
jgi:hypothetical protein